MIELFSFDDDKGAQELVFSELDEKIQDLFARVCVRKCGAALLRYLDTTNNSLHTIQDIAYQIREEASEVECGLSTLTELELTRVLRVADLEFFGATTDPARRQLIRDLTLWQDRWHGRIERIEHLVFGKARSALRRGELND